MEPKRLYRSTTDRKLAGVAAGLADYFELDPLLIRLIFVILTIAGGGGMLIYIILWIITPEEPFRSISGKPAEDRSTNSSENQPSGDGSQEHSPEPMKEQLTPEYEAKPVRKQKGSLIGGLVLITIGGLFLADELLPNINFWDLWPLILIVIGGGLLFNAITKRNQQNNPF